MKIEHYNFGSIKISGRLYDHDILILPTGVESWWRKQGHSVCLEDLEKIWQFAPDLMIFGKGWMGMMQVSEIIMNHLSTKGIEVIAALTKDAVDFYNEYSEKYPEKVVIGAFHLTC